MVSVFTTAGVYTLNGLTPATSYACSVFATNLYGNSLPANVSARTEDGGMCMYSDMFSTVNLDIKKSCHRHTNCPSGQSVTFKVL